MTSNRFTLWLTLYFLLVLNLPLQAQLVSIISSTDGELSTGFIISLPFFFGALFYFLFSLGCFPYLTKFISIVLVLTSSLVTYAMYSYGTLFDYSMIQNVFETNYGEVTAYLNLTAAGAFAFLGVVPALVIARTQIVYKPLVRELLHKLGGLVVSLAIIGVIAALYFKDYAAFGRNNSYLNKMIIPVEYIAATVKYVDRNILSEPLTHQQLGLDAKVIPGAKPRLTVLILGETARAANYQLNGYARATNQFTQQLGVVALQKVDSCGTATAISVPCMFSRMSRESFDGRAVRYQDSVIDVLTHAGINALWLDTDGGCKGVCDRVPTWNYTASTDDPLCVTEFCDDIIMLKEFDKAMAAIGEGDAILTLHVNGSHGPTYFERYGPEFQVFMPDCQRSDIQNCTNEEIVNTYDNTILHTDYVIAAVIKALDSRYAEYASRVVYISDHGESLGENGVYLHGMPYAMAPREQIEVPWIFWFSESAKQELQLDEQCLKAKAQSEQFSHDNFFDTMLGLMDVQTSIYRPDLDVLHGCRG
ncbi:MAG: phosphoethanolamine--lipid A transferase [Oceanospirillaceae bacterium]|nr:phosphoethanolamine--lipid A transferase [Oceanospirillaceae bacterium]